MELSDLLHQSATPPESLGLGTFILLGLLLGLLHQVRIGLDVVTLLVEHLKSEFAATGHSVRKLGAAIANPAPEADLRTDASLGSDHAPEFLDHAKHEPYQRSPRRQYSYQRIRSLVYRRVRHRLSVHHSAIPRDEDG